MSGPLAAFVRVRSGRARWRRCAAPLRAARCAAPLRCCFAALHTPRPHFVLPSLPSSPLLKQAGAVIGKGGELIRSIEGRTHAKIEFEPPPRGYDERVIHISSDE